MIQIEDKIISSDILQKKFVCDLNACKGACCVEGDSGAPLLEEEKEVLENNYKKIKTYMEKTSINVVENNGISIIDSEGDLTTNLVNGKECIFVSRDKGINKCSIEQAYFDGKINFQKPISCHLFPIRITKHSDFEALNYEEINICKPACKCGGKLDIPVYVFLKKALIRKYGEKWYQKLIKVLSQTSVILPLINYHELGILLWGLL